MDTILLDTMFANIGARLKVAARRARRAPLQGLVSLDVQPQSRLSHGSNTDETRMEDENLEQDRFGRL